MEEIIATPEIVPQILVNASANLPFKEPKIAQPVRMGTMIIPNASLVTALLMERCEQWNYKKTTFIFLYPNFFTSFTAFKIMVCHFVWLKELFSALAWKTFLVPFVTSVLRVISIFQNAPVSQPSYCSSFPEI